MSAGNIIALAAAAVAVAAVVVGWFQTNATLKQNRELADLEAVRAILDVAVANLRTATSHITGIQALADRPNARASICEAAGRTDESLSDELERLKVRFGLDHPIVQSFTQATDASSKITQAADAMLDTRGMGMEGGKKAEERRAALNKRREENAPVIEEEASRFECQRGVFMDEAHRLGRARLGEARTPPLAWLRHKLNVSSSR